MTKLIGALVLFMLAGAALYQLYEIAPTLCWGIFIVGGGIFLWSRLESWQTDKQRIAKEKERALKKHVFGKWIPSYSERAKALRRYDGHVYLIREEYGRYKIGYTVDVPTRFNTLKIQVPQKIEIVWSIKCHDHKKVEKELHRRYKPSRTRGEWFALTSEQVREITQLTDGELG